MARHPKCSKCGARLQGDRCGACHQRNLDGYYALKAKEKRLVEQGVHPRLAQRIVDIDIKKSCVQLFRVSMRARYAENVVQFSPRDTHDYQELVALGAEQFGRFQVAIGELMTEHLHGKNISDEREKLSFAVIEKAREFGVELMVYWDNEAFSALD